MNTTQLRTILNNVALARDHLVTVPENKLDLRSYRRDTDCGTLFCAMGELTTLPYFKAMGFRLGRLGLFETEKETVWSLEDTPEGKCASELMQEVFGQDAFSKLFAHYGSGKWDAELMAPAQREGVIYRSTYRPISDKKLILARFDKHIADLNAQLSST